MNSNIMNLATNYNLAENISRNRLEEILNKMKGVKITVIGDATIDVYWDADMTKSKLSRETPHFILPIVKERISLGGAANVANNLQAIGVGEVSILTVIGEDWRGREFKKLLKEKGIKEDYLIESNNWITPAYCKPIKFGISEIVYENPRLDFENQKKLESSLEKKIVDKLSQIKNQHSALAVVDQLENGIISEKIRKEIVEISSECITTVDSRENINKYNNVILKPNHIETMKAVSPEKDISESGIEDWIEAGLELSKITSSKVLMTIGEEGAVWIDYQIDSVIKIPTVPANGEIDFVGAGDTFMSAFIASFAVGAEPIEAVNIANLAASVTVKKIRITGTATKKEIINKYNN